MTTTTTTNNGQVSATATIIKSVSLTDVLATINAGGSVKFISPQKIGKNYTFDLSTEYTIKDKDGKISFAGHAIAEGTRKSIVVSPDTKVEIIVSEAKTAEVSAPAPNKKSTAPKKEVKPVEEVKEEPTAPVTIAEQIAYFTAAGDIESLSTIASRLNELVESFTSIAEKQEKLTDQVKTLNGGVVEKKVKVKGTKKETDPLSVAPIKPYRWSYQQYGDALYQCFLDLASDDAKKVKQATITLFSEFDMQHSSINEFKAGFHKALRSDLKAETMKFIALWKAEPRKVSIGMLAKTWKKEESLMREELDRMKLELGIK